MELIPTMVCLSALLFLGTLTYAQEPENKTISSGPVAVDVKGRAGEIKLRLRNNTKKFISIRVSRIREVGEDGEFVTNSRRKLKDFDRTNFKIDAAKMGKRYNLSAAYFSLAANLTEQGNTASIEAIIFREDGTAIGEAGEEYTVKKGSLKLNIDIRNWDYCTPNTCDGKMTKYLEADIVFKTNSKKLAKKALKKLGVMKSKKFKEPITEEFGDASKAIFSRVVKSGGNWTNMPEGYPKSSLTKRGLVYTFRFPVGKKIFYDPVIQLSSDGDDDTSSSATVNVSALTGMVVISLVNLLIGKFLC